ncbi:MAG: Smr/MutS family protein [Clostridia bacterium]|nr:Smr/MutS family protein [Clostridia bacterium]
MPYSIEIDLHGHTVESAKTLLNDSLKKLPKDVREINVIHGYRGGTALRDMVRKYSHPKIERKILGLNQGITTFIIKK